MGGRCGFFSFHTLVLAFLFSFLSAANAEYESVHRCDMVGAHFNDLQKWATGVTDEELAPQLAIKFCSIAVEEHPDTGRFHFQLGRALWKAQFYDEATDSLIKAVELDHAAAYAYLAEAYALGLGGYDVDLETAKDFFEAAAEGGFETNEDNLALLKQVSFTPIDFERPDIIDALYNGDFSSLTQNRFLTLLYLMTFNQYFMSQKEYSFFQDLHSQNPAACGLLYDPEVDKILTLQYMYKDNPIWGNAKNEGEMLNNSMQNIGELLKKLTSMTNGGRGGFDRLAMIQKVSEGSLELEIIKKSAEKDAFRLAASYGCESEITEGIYKNIKKFAKK
jgi:tetratricopeptide (TPR) repeat protein